MIMPLQEQPIYSIYGSKARALIPKIISLSGLSAIFYLFVLINISLLELDATQETTLKTGALSLLAILILIGTVSTFRKVQQPYLFFRNTITHGKETIDYANITNTTPQATFFDSLFKTYCVQFLAYGPHMYNI